MSSLTITVIHPGWNERHEKLIWMRHFISVTECMKLYTTRLETMPNAEQNMEAKFTVK